MYYTIQSYSLFDFLFFSCLLFLISILGIILTRKNIILTIVSIELLFLAVNLNFIIFSIFLDDLIGQVFALYIIAVAGAEAAIGLAILIVFYRLRKVISVDYISSIKG